MTILILVTHTDTITYKGQEVQIQDLPPHLQRYYTRPDNANIADGLTRMRLKVSFDAD